MAKYDPLRDLSRPHGTDVVRLTMDEIAALVPGGLPPSAYRHGAWWANDGHHSHVQARAWLDVGRAATPDLGARTVTFDRRA